MSTTQPADSELVSIAEIASRLECSRSSAYRGCARGEIASFRIGGRVFVPREPFERMMAGRDRGPSNREPERNVGA